MGIEEKPKKERVTIKDVAKAADVSIATVSYVLNNKPGQSISDETRKKVLQFANLLGYECNVMAKYLATGKTGAVTVVVKDFDTVGAHYYLQLLTELSRVLGKQNLDLKVSDYASAITRGTTCDGYITLALSENDFRTFADTQFVPVVAVDTELEDRLFYHINDDYKAMCERARSEFNGRKIVLLTHALTQQSLSAAQKHFDEVMVTTETAVRSLDTAHAYVTVSKALYDAAVDTLDVRPESESVVRKAEAAVDAVIKAVQRVNCLPEEHNIRV